MLATLFTIMEIRDPQQQCLAKSSFVFFFFLKLIDVVHVSETRGDDMIFNLQILI